MYTLMARLPAAAASVVTFNTNSGFMIASTHRLDKVGVQVVTLLDDYQIANNARATMSVQNAVKIAKYIRPVAAITAE